MDVDRERSLGERYDLLTREQLMFVADHERMHFQISADYYAAKLRFEVGNVEMLVAAMGQIAESLEFLEDAVPDPESAQLAVAIRLMCDRVLGELDHRGAYGNDAVTPAAT